ncbi:MAG: PIN domain-containing protein [Acidobacteria bacterium]|nr:PIN domain-containing protein [Acidobacteriota bacterium]
MARKTECYADTGAFIAFLDKSDSYHALFRRLFSDPPPLSTSALVLAEGHGWFLRRYDQRRAIEFLNFVDALPVLTIEGFGADAVKRSSKWLRKFSDQTLTLADAHGLVVMGDRRITSCWSTDRHMTLTGATLVT